MNRVAGAQADVVDSAQRSTLPSTLQHPANLAAQSLWQRPELRGLSAPGLARELGIRPIDARDGIAAIVSMATDVARGARNPVLHDDRSLSGALGNLSMDQAMARYGSRMGRIVRTPEPRFSRIQQFGAGSIDATLSSATQQMIDFINQNGCGPSPAGIVANFQAAANAAGYTPALATDDKYGPLTQAATAKVLSDSQNVGAGETLPNALTGYTAPASCHYGAVVVRPSAPVGPAPAPAPNAVMPAAPMAPSQAGFLPKTPLGWAALAAVAAVIALANSRHRPKWVPKELRFVGKR